MEGRALLSSSNGAKAYLDWGIGLGYRNEIDLWAENGSFFTDKIFSKPEDYQPVFRLRRCHLCYSLLLSLEHF